MSLFTKLKNAIFSKISHKKTDISGSTPPSNPDPSFPPIKESQSSSAAPASPAPAQTQKLTAAELAGQLDAMAAENSEKLAWRTSIVDLMKLVGMESGFSDRKEMALELGYGQEQIDSKGSAEMNIWLHKKVMEKLSEDTDGDLLQN